MKKTSPFKPWTTEEALRILVEGVKDYAIFMVDKHGKIITWNEGAEKIFGWKELEVMNKDVSVIFTPEDVKNNVHVQEQEQAAAKGQAVDKRFHRKKNGQKFYAEGGLTAMRDELGQICGFIKICKVVPQKKH
jgi:two-component system, NtrC family, sensor kinase